MKSLILAGRLLFGAWMLANGLNYLFLALWPTPVGHEPLAVQLMAALVHSHLYGVAMTLQLVGGAMILAGVLVPVALCVLMPVSTCALYWAAVLDHQPLGALLAVVAFALNGLLMLAYLDAYRGALQRHARAIGESPGDGAFDPLFTSALGRTGRGPFAGALVTLLAVAAFYAFRVTGLTAHWCLLMLVLPSVMLHARRFRDMGQTPWLLIVPVLLTLAAFAVWLHLVTPGAGLVAPIYWTAVVVSTAFALWGCLAPGRGPSSGLGSHPIAA